MADSREEDRAYELDDTRSLASKASFEDEQLLAEDPLHHYPDNGTGKVRSCATQRIPGSDED